MEAATARLQAAADWAAQLSAWQWTALAAGLYAALWVWDLVDWYLIPPPAGKRPPRAFLIPLLGSPFILYHVIQGTGLTAMLGLQRKLGAVFGVRIMGLNSTVLTDPRDVQHVLKDNFSNYIKGSMFRDRLTDLLGDGIFNVDGHQWLTQRKTASHMFSREMLRDVMLPVFQSHSARLARRLVTAASNGKRVVDLQDEFSRLTLDAISKIAFGVDVKAQSGHPLPFAKAFDDAQWIANRRFVKPHWPLMRALDVGTERQLRRAIRVIDAFAYRVIRTRREEAERTASGSIAVGTSGVDLLTRFVALKDKDGTPMFTERELRDVVLNFMIAGRDTTATVLTWMVYLLALHPRVLARLRQELDAVAEEDLDYQTVMHGLPYAHAVMSETLRLYPSVPKDGKMAVKSDVLPSGYYVPAGSFIGYNMYVMGRRKELWGEDAEQFRPERWLEMDKPPSAFKFTAFNAGPRTCLGQRMAYLESLTVLHTVVTRFDFDLAPDFKPVYRMTLTLPMRDGLPVHVRPRGEGSWGLDLSDIA